MHVSTNTQWYAGIYISDENMADLSPSAMYVTGFKRAIFATVGENTLSLFQIKKILPIWVNGPKMRSHVLLINQFQVVPNASIKKSVERKNKDTINISIKLIMFTSINITSLSKIKPNKNMGTVVISKSIVNAIIYSAINHVREIGKVKW